MLKFNTMNLLMKSKVSYRGGRYYIKGTNIRIDLVIGLGAKEILENYPWLSPEQVKDSLSFVKDLVAKRGQSEASTKEIQAA